MNSKYGLLFGVVFFGLLASLAAAAGSPQGASVSSNNTGVSLGTSADGSKALTAGNVYNVNLSVQAVSNRWAGVFGNVTGTLALTSTVSTQRFFNWSASTTALSGNVLAYNGTDVPTWSYLSNQDLLTKSDLDTLLSYTTTESDSASNTFTSTNTAFTIGAYNFGATASTTAKTYNSAGVATYETSAVNYSAGTSVNGILYVGQIQGTAVGFDGRQWNYQLLLPNNQVGSSSTSTYYFYAMLE